MFDYILGHLRKWWILKTTKPMTEEASKALDDYLVKNNLYPKE